MLAMQAERMERFGDELRGERERRGMSIETICAVTKVSQRHLQALEANRFGELPGGVFRKGILRSYLSTLGLDAAGESNWMSRFDDALRSAGLASDPEADWTEFAVNVKRNRQPAASGLGLTRWLGVFAMLLVLGALSWVAWRYAIQPHLRHQATILGSHAAGSLTGRRP
ncbi:hypothetical protein FTO74_12820 [Granulicella sp. WH15]|uniref:helix-turn-helix domain-containing protein n=1 Tax=Granulicella sp. WH15 TaxID=2602070 RepID=UPI001366EE0F|nr:helix-turn-helix domain-containing protein [Granulicella sp. WH15]QHN04151.1 hypothetical protein FTO74_12820 [Granulicella sp. WH15]